VLFVLTIVVPALKSVATPEIFVVLDAFTAVAPVIAPTPEETNLYVGVRLVGFAGSVTNTCAWFPVFAAPVTALVVPWLIPIPDTWINAVVVPVAAAEVTAEIVLFAPVDSALPAKS
jgi:hypothetical protein